MSLSIPPITNQLVATSRLVVAALLALASLGMAWAQTLPNDPNTLLGAAVGAQPGLQQPGLQQPGLQQPSLQQPSLQQPGLQPAAARPDFGALDIQRNNLSPLRAPKLQTPSQFQKFVQESTGKLLPLFGASLLKTPWPMPLTLHHQPQVNMF